MAEQQQQTATEQIQHIFGLYHRTDMADQAQRKALAELINGANLPAYHKEVMAQVLLTLKTDQVTLGLYVLRQREYMRHADALLKIESACLAERGKRDQTAPKS